MKNFHIHIFLLLFSISSFARSISDLEKKKSEKYKEIEYINVLLKKIENKQKGSLNNIILLKSKIELRNQIVDQISQQIELLNLNIYSKSNEIKYLDSIIFNLKVEYAKTIYNFHKINNNKKKLIYILSSNDINQTYTRIKYLQQYIDYRKKQKLEILNLKDTIQQKVLILEIEKNSKQKLFEESISEKSNLLKEENDQNILIKNLKIKEKEYRKKLKENEKATLLIENEIKKIIEQEAAKLKSKSDKQTKSKSDIFQSLSKEDKILSDDLKKNKLKLPWPVEKGIVTSHFGEHPHPLYKGIKIKNNGIDIATNSGTNVRCIFNGVVSRIFAIKGTNYTIIIRHGNYMSVYQNVINIKVNIGDVVQTKQIIGLTDENSDDNSSHIHFELWDNFNKLNPIEWLIK